MTREEAIKIIDCYDINFYDLSGKKIPAHKLAEAFDMAIESLSEDRVYCMNCIHGEERIEQYRCNRLDEDWEIRFSPTHFCSWGERRKE